ncbi:MAG TPA: cysteine--tRNA ligase, partial [Smithella sp.]|nr:cysteine--tRNA ligase [Smithella sp.]
YVNAFQMLKDKFNEAMDDDFNTAQALGYVFDMVRQMNNFMMKEKSMPVADKTAVLAAAIRVFDYFGSVLGVINSDADQFFVLYRETELRRRELNADEIEELIRQRQSAREAKDWARADDIRKKLAGMNVVLKDSADGTSWTIE